MRERPYAHLWAPTPHARIEFAVGFSRAALVSWPLAGEHLKVPLHWHNESAGISGIDRGGGGVAVVTRL